MGEKWLREELRRIIINAYDAYTNDLMTEKALGEMVDLFLQLQKESEERVLNDFSEFCHEKYLGSSQNPSSKTGFDYAYEKEVVTMVEEYKLLNQNEK